MKRESNYRFISLALTMMLILVALCACGAPSSQISDVLSESDSAENRGELPKDNVATATPFEQEELPKEGEVTPVEQDEKQESNENAVDISPIIGSWISEDGTTLTFNEDGTGHIHVEVNYGNGLMGDDNDKDFKWQYDDSFESYLVNIGAVLTATIDESDVLSMAGVNFIRIDSNDTESNAG